MQDQSIIDQLKSGNKDLLEDVYQAYRNEFFSWVINQYRCELDDAKDHYQFAVLTFYENVMSGKLTALSSSIKTYLFAIGKNKVLEAQKKSSRYADQLVELPQNSERGEIEEKEKRMQAVEKCLNDLGEPCSSLLKQYYYHQRSMDEIASLFNYSNRDTAKNLKFKCMQRLRKLVKEHYLNVA